MGLRLLIDNVTISEVTTVPFLLGPDMVPSTIWCRGVAETGEDVLIQKLMSNQPMSSAPESHWATIKRDNILEAINGQTNVRTIDGPGAYRIKTQSSTAGPITVGYEW